MSQPPPALPRPVAPDPTRVTEFASPEYFDKLTQQRQQKQRDAHQTQSSSAAPSSHQLEGPEWDLPIRISRPSDIEAEPKQKKSRFGLGRLLHSAKEKTVSSTIASIPEQKRSSVSSDTIKPRTRGFDELFGALPAELQIQVIQSLPLRSLLDLRISSKYFHELVTLHEVSIVRYHLHTHIPAYAKRLYPPPEDLSQLNLHYLCGVWHRLVVASKLAHLITEWATKEIFLRGSEVKQREFQPQRERMRRRLIPLIFTIFHFFEQYRDRHIDYLLKNNGRGLSHTPFTLNPIEVAIMSQYDDQTLLQVHQVFPLVVAAFCRRLRPPSYVGRAERTIRGYIREKPTDDVHVATLCVGGLRQVEHFWEIKGYNDRVGAVHDWYNSIAREGIDLPKAKRGFMGLGRKKSSTNIRDADKTDPPRKSRGSWDAYGSRRDSFIFNTSLSAGMPMSPLPLEHLQLMLADLPVLQKLWLSTAEALILDRKIVDHPSHIRRNAQVMMDLIEEDTKLEEDDWWCGQAAEDSLRPCHEATEEDTVEGA